MSVISLPIRCIVIILILLLPSAGSATDNSSGVLLRFLETEHTPRIPLLPDSFSIADDFEPGVTSPAGFVLRV
ncbi:MAG: hypothetical protein D3906_08035, partial [Candidatus Electrothrix sp. AUS1_2]|nr:hypothetical protein [Candidatus Electrothrix sp. AUS1_2]